MVLRSKRINVPCQDSVEYLGHRIDASGIHTTGSKVEAVLKALAPKNVRELSSFLGLLHHYSAVIDIITATK